MIPSGAGSPLAIIPFTYGNITSVIVDELPFFWYADTDIRGFQYNHGGDGTFSSKSLPTQFLIPFLIVSLRLNHSIPSS